MGRLVGDRKGDEGEEGGHEERLDVDSPGLTTQSAFLRFVSDHFVARVHVSRPARREADSRLLLALEEAKGPDPEWDEEHEPPRP